MKYGKLTIITAIALLMLTSCELFGGGEHHPSGTGSPAETGSASHETRPFHFHDASPKAAKWMQEDTPEDAQNPGLYYKEGDSDFDVVLPDHQLPGTLYYTTNIGVYSTPITEATTKIGLTDGHTLEQGYYVYHNGQDGYFLDMYGEFDQSFWPRTQPTPVPTATPAAAPACPKPGSIPADDCVDAPIFGAVIDGPGPCDAYCKAPGYPVDGKWVLED